MREERGTPQRPRRTRSHIIASQSHNYIEKFFIDKGHTVNRPGEDYGYDLLVNTFDDLGYAESGEIRIQLKASDKPKYSRDKSFISFKISRKHFELWMSEAMPVFLILYDARQQTAYWVYVQDRFGKQSPHGFLRSGSTCTLRIPLTNEFTEATVDYARERKAAILAQIEGKMKHHD